jgi:hypothetical protein
MSRRLWYRDSYGRWRQDRHAEGRSGMPAKWAFMALMVLAGFRRRHRVDDPLRAIHALTLKRQRSLATRVPASDSCHLLVRAASVKVVFACTFTRGSPTGAVVLRSQTALTGSDRPRTIPAAGAGTPRLRR